MKAAESSQGSILIWPRTAADGDDNSAVEVHYAAVVWLIPDCSLSGGIYITDYPPPAAAAATAEPGSAVLVQTLRVRQ